MAERNCPYCGSDDLHTIATPSADYPGPNSLPDAVFECRECVREFTSWQADHPDEIEGESS